MAPQENERDDDDTNKDKLDATAGGETAATSAETPATVVICPPNNAPSYIRCSSQEPFALHRVSSSSSSNGSDSSTTPLTPEEVNQQLNLNLGQKWICPDSSKLLLWIIRLCDKLMIRWWEPAMHYIIRHVLPTRLKRFLIFAAWRVYYPLHARLLGRSTAIHPDASLEYHALTTVMWWGRLFPVTVQRMRFALSQLTVWTPTPAKARIEYIQETMNLGNINSTTTTNAFPERQKDHVTVRGIFAHFHQQQATEYTIFWLYGGAFLSGDAQGNLGPACQVGAMCRMDVFLPTYRLVPEGKLEDCIWDVAVAYHWLCQRKQQLRKDNNMDAVSKKIILFGISSGAALGIKLMQTIAEIGRKEQTLPRYLQSAFSLKNSTATTSSDNAGDGSNSISTIATAATTSTALMPGGAVIMCPYIDYTEPKGSFLHYQKHDLIVNQRVMESGLPYLETHLGDGTHHDRKPYSPLYRNCQDLPPLCVVVSEHEVVYDQTIEFVNKCRSVGVNVTLGLWQYMCHVFCFLGGFAPEGEQSINFVVDWINQQTEQPKQGEKEAM